MTTAIKNHTAFFFLLLTSVPPVYSQHGFVELRKEITAFDNTRCISQEYTISLPYFDLQEKGSVIKQINDSLYNLAATVLKDMNKEVLFEKKNWAADKMGIDSCISGINITESRDIYYSIFFNDKNLLSFIIRNDWIVEKQMILKSDYVTAEQEQVYCFTVDLESDKLIDVNSLFKAEDRPKIIDMIRSEYELEYEEDMLKAGDRLRYCGLLLTPLKLIAGYTMLLPDEESEVRTIELPLNELYDFMQPKYQQVFKTDAEK